MSRISKNDVSAALSLAAKLLETAGGPDGRVSRTDVARALPTLPAAQRALVDAFYRFVDARDLRPGAAVTKRDLDEAVAFAREELIAKYDLNNNGLSAGEVAQMGEVGKLAVELAKLLKAANNEPLAPPRLDEGYSEPAEILAAGQVPRDWTPDVHLNAATLNFSGRTYTGFTTSQSLTAEQHEVANAALAVVWDRVLQHRADGVSSLAISPRDMGTLKVGDFTRRDDGKTYLVADWRDIDDGSYTLYFERHASGRLRLAIEQYNN